MELELLKSQNPLDYERLKNGQNAALSGQNGAKNLGENSNLNEKNSRLSNQTQSDKNAEFKNENATNQNAKFTNQNKPLTKNLRQINELLSVLNETANKSLLSSQSQNKLKALESLHLLANSLSKDLRAQIQAKSVKIVDFRA